MRGGVSLRHLSWPPEYRYSPHAWGCFHFKGMEYYRTNVFPTCVGVFPKDAGKCLKPLSIPHMRGGVSDQTYDELRERAYSPHAWGCFCCSDSRGSCTAVFPTCVGVFLYTMIRGYVPNGIPHMRGGVSVACILIVWVFKYSPHAWGCFLRSCRRTYCDAVFPTCVGVFPCYLATGSAGSRIPHMRGGVSRKFFT